MLHLLIIFIVYYIQTRSLQESTYDQDIKNSITRKKSNMAVITAPIGIEQKYYNAIVSQNEECIYNVSNEGKELGTVVSFLFKNEFFHAAVLFTSFENITISNDEGNMHVIINDTFEDDTCIVIQLINIINTNEYKISYTTHNLTHFLKYDLIFFPPMGRLNESQLKIFALSATPITYNTANENCLDYCKKLLLLVYKAANYGTEDKTKSVTKLVQSRLDRIQVFANTEYAVIKPLRNKVSASSIANICLLIIKSSSTILKLNLAMLCLVFLTNTVILLRL